jgi:hypothetical protein
VVALARAVAAADAGAEGLALGSAPPASRSRVGENAGVGELRANREGDAEAPDVDPEEPSIRRGTCHKTMTASATDRIATILRCRPRATGIERSRGANLDRLSETL